MSNVLWTPPLGDDRCIVRACSDWRVPAASDAAARFAVRCAHHIKVLKRWEAGHGDQDADPPGVDRDHNGTIGTDAYGVCDDPACDCPGLPTLSIVTRAPRA